MPGEPEIEPRQPRALFQPLPPWTTAMRTMVHHRRLFRRIRLFGGTRLGIGPRRHRGLPVPPEQLALQVHRAPAEPASDPQSLRRPIS